MQLVLLLHEIRPLSKGLVLLHERHRKQIIKQTCASKLVLNQRLRFVSRA